MKQMSLSNLSSDNKKRKSNIHQHEENDLNFGNKQKMFVRGIKDTMKQLQTNLDKFGYGHMSANPSPSNSIDKVIQSSA